jgi:hypothetical protein
MPKINTKFVLLSVGGIALIILFSVVVLPKFKSKDTTPQQSADQIKLQEEEKKAAIDPKKDTEAYNRQQTPTPQASPTASQPSQKLAAIPTITQAEQSGSNVIIKAIVDNNGGPGNCIATLTRSGSADVQQTKPTVLVTSYYACQTFQIPRSQFGSAGTWSVAVKFESDKAAGTSTKQSVAIN